MKSRFFLRTFFSLFLVSTILCSCGGHDSNESATGEPSKSFAIHEHDLAENPDLVITPEDVVVVDLEPPDGVYSPDDDTATAGVDRIPLFFSEDGAHYFIVEYHEEEAFLVKLYNQNGNPVALLNQTSPTSVQAVSVGEYTIEIINEEEVQTSQTLFVRPGGGATYIGPDCPGCFLQDVDLSDSDLSGADLTGADLTGADLTGADLTGADLDLISISVPNAGLVLCGAFLRLLFEKLELLNGAEFRSETERQKAITCLQYLATGGAIRDENDLALNKVLCGYPLNEPVETIPELTESETAMINGLINAMISYWSAIGQSSIDGFRGNWLVRNGTLTEKEDHWELIVEKRAYDVLLNQAPFSYSIIKFPWMNKPIYVTWPS